MKIFCFDAETDGLYGPVYAIAAVVYDNDREICSFTGKSQVDQLKNEWVLKNCALKLEDFKEFNNRNELLDEFWSFYVKNKADALILVDCPYPVEADLIRKCVEKDIENRIFQGPYPLIDVASVLYAKNIDPLIDRMEFSGYNGQRHNPLDDARASVLSFLKAMTM